MKKQFVTPRVVQQVPICLENDLLARSADNLEVTTDDMYFENTDYGNDQEWTNE